VECRYATAAVSIPSAPGWRRRDVPALPASADLPTPVGGGVDGRSQQEGGLQADEGRREAWWFDAVAAAGSLAVAVCVGRRPSVGRGWYWAVVAGAGRKTVWVMDPDLALPASGPALELRAPGLWADHNPSAPGGHWSVAAEAFGVALDDPWDAWDRAFGDPTPVGLDLEWDPVTPPLVLDGDLGGPAGSWAVGCEVHGEVLVGDERFELTCTGSRGRWWGSAGGWSAQGWSQQRVVGEFRDEAGAPQGEVPSVDAVVAWAPVLDGAGFDGTARRLGMAVVGGPGELAGVRGWVRWCPPGGPGEDDRPPGDARPGGTG
jgi:hypothetical protein